MRIFLVALFGALQANGALIDDVNFFEQVCPVSLTITEFAYDERSQIYNIVYNRIGRILGSEEEKIDDSVRFLEEQPKTPAYGRRCACRERYDIGSVYCPIGISHCGVPKGSNELLCVNQPTQHDFSANMFYVVIAWFSFLFIWLVISRPGRFLLSYFVSWCIPGWNKRWAGRLMQNRPEEAYHLMRRNIYLNRHSDEDRRSEFWMDAQAVAHMNVMVNDEDDAGDDNSIVDDNKNSMEPNRLALKCRNLNENDDEEEDCTICCQPFEKGERVGDLRCGHTFHVSCLKEWCVRRNVCPLCQDTEIAEPRYEIKDVEAGLEPEPDVTLDVNDSASTSSQ